MYGNKIAFVPGYIGESSAKCSYTLKMCLWYFSMRHCIVKNVVLHVFLLIKAINILFLMQTGNLVDGICISKCIKE